MVCPTGSALLIGAPGITLDLAGHTVRGGDTETRDRVGITTAPAANGVTVKNGRVYYDGVIDGAGRVIDGRFRGFARRA